MDIFFNNKSPCLYCNAECDTSSNKLRCLFLLGKIQSARSTTTSVIYA